MKLYYLLGRSASGKDTIFKRILNNEEIQKTNLTSLVSHTTRPKRENEIENFTYFFDKESDLLKYEKADDVLECRRYDTINGAWYYFTLFSDFKEENNYIGIGDLYSLEKLRKMKSLEIRPIYIYVEEGELLTRALNREKSQKTNNYLELCRRFIADSKDFSKERLDASNISKIIVNDDLDKATSEILEYILKDIKDIKEKNK